MTNRVYFKQMSLAAKKDNQAFYPDEEPDSHQPPFLVEKPFWQRFILNKMDRIAHLPKNIPYAEEILENIPFYGEDVYTVSIHVYTYTMSIHILILTTMPMVLEEVSIPLPSNFTIIRNIN